MKHDVKKLLLSVLLLVLCVFANNSFVNAATTTTGNTLMVNNTCYTYSKKSGAASYRKELMTFGTEVTVTSRGKDWTTVKYAGTTRYMMTKNLDYLVYSVTADKAAVNPTAATATAAKRLGYVHSGDEVTVLGTKKTSSGTFIYCQIKNVYDATKANVLKTNAKGYINTKYLAQKSTPMIVKGGCNIYKTGYSSSSPKSAQKASGQITTGEEVNVIADNGTWSKILYKGKISYIRPANLEKKVMQVKSKTLAMRETPSSAGKKVRTLYWNSLVTILGSYKKGTSVSYYYCEYEGDRGFLSAKSVGYTTLMEITGGTNLRSTASSSAKSVASLPSGEEVSVQYVSGNWARITYKGKTGYASSGKLDYRKCKAEGSYYKSAYRLYKDNPSGELEKSTVSLIAADKDLGYAYIRTSSGAKYWIKMDSISGANHEKMVYTTAPFANLHTEANSTSGSKMIPYMSELTLLQTYNSSAKGSWNKVKYDGKIYYLWVEKNSDILTETKSTFDYHYSSNTQIQNDIVDKAMEICMNWKTAYGHGDSTGIPDQDGVCWFDCSGFAVYVLEQAMQKYMPSYDLSSDIEVLYTTKYVYNRGYSNSLEVKDIDLADVKTGDILFFDLADEGSSDEKANRGYTHCGIYLGNNEFVHCSSYWSKVCIMPLTNKYADKLVAVKRYIPEKVAPANQQMKVTSYVNVRADKSSSADVIAQLKPGDIVTLLYYDNNVWAQIKFGDDELGYVSISYLTKAEEQNSANEAESNETFDVELPQSETYTDDNNNDVEAEPETVQDEEDSQFNSADENEDTNEER